MSIANFAKSRNISEILHFTTNHGCLGTLYTKNLKSRARLENDPMVEYLFRPNANLRKDPAYVDYVNLSISHINTQYYGISSGNWHRHEDIFWCILSFDPEILSHEGVVFATTNNIYTGVQRDGNTAGLERLFANPVIRWNGNVALRAAQLPERFPTCEQAEVLYPGEIPTGYLRRMYTRTNSEQSEVMAFIKGALHEDVDVVVDPSRFGPRPTHD